MERQEEWCSLKYKTWVSVCLTFNTEFTQWCAYGRNSDFTFRISFNKNNLTLRCRLKSARHFRMLSIHTGSTTALVSLSGAGEIPWSTMCWITPHRIAIHSCLLRSSDSKLTSVLSAHGCYKLQHFVHYLGQQQPTPLCTWITFLLRIQSRN